MAGAAQTTKKGKGAGVELQHVGPHLQILLSLSPKEVATCSWLVWTMVNSIVGTYNYVTSMLQVAFAVRPPLAVLASLIDRGMLTIRLQKVQTHPMAPPCCIQVMLGTSDMAVLMLSSYAFACGADFSGPAAQIMLSKADPQQLVALRDAVHCAIMGSRQPLQTLHPNTTKVLQLTVAGCAALARSHAEPSTCHVSWTGSGQEEGGWRAVQACSVVHVQQERPQRCRDCQLCRLPPAWPGADACTSEQQHRHRMR